VVIFAIRVEYALAVTTNRLHHAHLREDHRATFLGGARHS
jgi:hypothetical protein